MARESTQHKLDRVRPPRVQITYDVQIGDAMEQKELPFVLGVLGAYSGHGDPNAPLPRLKDRKFVSIDRDNFDGVLAAQNPTLRLRVRNRLQKDTEQLMGVDLKFGSLQDFEPDRVVNQVDPLRKLIEERNRLREAVSKLSSNERLSETLRDVLRNTEQLQTLARDAGQGGEPAQEAP
jgi:type VI secretion system protein ImpB